MADGKIESPSSVSSSSKAPLYRSNSASILLNKYELGKLLGRGSFAKVYAARAIATKELVAIKVIEKKLGTEAVMETRIIAEVSAMKKVESHPNILKIQEVMASKAKIYLVMELAVGGELYTKILQRGRLKEPLARRYFHQLVSALHFCHQNGIAHRDVKPQNLLLDKNGDIKLSDFGLSSLSESSSNLPLRTACGTPAFSAPEVFARRGYDGRKADAWSCGVVLFFFLTGCLPFDDSNIASMYKRMQRKEYQLPGWVSRPARGLIMSLLDPNPRSRMTLEEAMTHSWFSFKCSELGKVDSSVSLVEMENSNHSNTRDANAFDIISMSSGLDLSRLFIGEEREKRFTSEEPMGKVMGKVKEVGGKMGFHVEEKSGVAMGWGNGAVSLLFQGLQLADTILLVEIKLVAAGDWGTHNWRQLKKSLHDIVLQWND